MAVNYGERYLKVDDFVTYCAKLNVKTDKGELEYYEKTGVMMPMARVVYPDDYVIWDNQKSLGMPNEPPAPDKWPELQRLSEKLRFLPKNYADLTDEELVHCFDREMGQNCFLFRPTPETYKPWSNYRVPVLYSDGQQFSCSSADHYYSYWQAHQLYYVKQYPDLYENRVLLDKISEEVKQRIFRPWAPKQDDLREFNGMAHLFDALSFWITIYARERKRTFALIPEKFQVKSLDNLQFQAYKNRLLHDAQLIERRFGLNIDSLYGFLYQLIELSNKYQHDERDKLRKELSYDIIYQAQFIEVLSGVEWETIEGELGKRYPYWVKQSFRHLNIATKERDDAQMIITGYAEKYGEVLTQLKIPSPYARVFSKNEVDELLNYCEQEGLSVFITALSGMVATDDEVTEKFRRITRYTNLKNALNAFEFLLKDLAVKGHVPTDRLTLMPLIKAVMGNEKWCLLFNAKTGLASGNNTADFFNNLQQLMGDPQLVQSEDVYWARVFLITLLARNLTVHMHCKDDWFYSELFGEMLHAVVYSVLYSWQVAKREKWV